MLAHETQPGQKYRPTRSASFDLRGRAWLTRPAPGAEARVIKRLKKNSRGLTGRQCCLLARVLAGDVLMRKHWNPTEELSGQWIAVPASKNLRGVKR